MAKVLVIDEGEYQIAVRLQNHAEDASTVSMVDGKLFEVISDIARQLQRCDIAFGGMQVNLSVI